MEVGRRMTDDNEFKPGDYDLSKLCDDSLCAIALLDELRIALPLANEYEKQTGDGKFCEQIQTMIGELSKAGVSHE